MRTTGTVVKIMLHFYPWFPEVHDFSKQFSFPWEVWKIPVQHTCNHTSLVCFGAISDKFGQAKDKPGIFAISKRCGGWIVGEYL